ncbi:MAG: UvrB/UvrC motif-containing protein [Mycoplasmoidaceae bacterium]|nr:UvrB/UvrC motif-containing protein [Mycoplasmoidaceae bacterium]
MLVIDEAHMTIPQIRGMYFGDRSRKQTLVDYGFRLPSALDNRPLNFNEFESRVRQAIYVSATPGDYEKQKSNNLIIEQIVRPTGLVDPVIQIKPTANQILTLCEELDAQIKRHERTIITVLTIRMAENLTKFLKEKKYKVAYLHNELKTFERDKVINALRKGIYDVVVGINLLREGLDVPEVSCAVIFDADKPGIFRSRDALIQTFGRTARNKNAHVLLFADNVNDALLEAINETNRRRKIQLDFNKKHNIVPQTIIKPIRDDLHGKTDARTLEAIFHKDAKVSQKDGSRAIKKLRKKMEDAAKQQEYELAAHYRDLMIELESKLK